MLEIEASSDEALARSAVDGDLGALGRLLARQQGWIFNVALRLLQVRADAEDATQDILLRITTRLATFRHDCAFRTWAYRVAMNHLLDRRRSRAEAAVHGFECYAAYLAAAPDEAASPEEALVVEEAKHACLLGMLLCLDRPHRLAFILGALLDVDDALGAAALDVSRDNYRQRLSRARRQLRAFMAGTCGLVDPANPCRCARKTRSFVRDGIVDPERLVFAANHLDAARRAARRDAARVDGAVGDVLRDLCGPATDYPAPDVAGRLRAAVSRGGLAGLFALAPQQTEEGDS
jgi:RNA polymerase sigma factor (sigma-70 family)